MKYKINLLPQKETPIVDRLMYFSLNYLRYIIVITLLVVVGVFFYRFNIDQSVIDLKDSVDQKQQIVNIVLPLLNQASNIDYKSTEIETLINKQQNFNGMLQYLLSVFPESVTLTKLSIKENSLTMIGTATDPKQLQAFLAVLKTNQRFSDIELQSVKRNISGYEFTLVLNNYKSG